MEVAVYNIKGEDTGRKVTLTMMCSLRDLSEGNADHTFYLDVNAVPGQPAPGHPQEQGAQRSLRPSSPVSSVVRKVVAAHVAVTSTLRAYRGGGTVSVPVRATTALSLTRK